MIFKVPQGSLALVVVSEDEGFVKRSITTKKENVFEEKEVRIDPTGALCGAKVAGPSMQTVGGLLARDGFYGFFRDQKMLIVHKLSVVVSGHGDAFEDEEGESSGE